MSVTIPTIDWCRLIENRIEIIMAKLEKIEKRLDTLTGGSK